MNYLSAFGAHHESNMEREFFGFIKCEINYKYTK